MLTVLVARGMVGFPKNAANSGTSPTREFCYKHKTSYWREMLGKMGFNGQHVRRH
jgi:hypothetical protein